MGIFGALYIARSNAHTAARYSDGRRPVELYHVLMGVSVALWIGLVILIGALAEALLGASMDIFLAVVIAAIAAVVARFAYLVLLGVFYGSR